MLLHILSHFLHAGKALLEADSSLGHALCVLKAWWCVSASCGVSLLAGIGELECVIETSLADPMNTGNALD